MKTIEDFFPTLHTSSSKHQGELEEFKTVMQKQDAVQGLLNYLESPNFPSCLDEAM